MAKKSRASKAPFLKPTIPIHFQVDFPKSGFIETNINKYGCYFLSLLAIPQFFTKQALSQPTLFSSIKNVMSKIIWVQTVLFHMLKNCTTWCTLSRR